MCGINGFIQNDGAHEEKLRSLKAMNDALTHRGPDAEGDWHYQEKLYFGHRRLSIIDLSELGHQPMLSASGNSAVVLNGEIYNFQELSSQLDIKLKSTSDTEVLLEYLEKFGLEKTLQDIRGMFAFAYFNVTANELSLARDPFGEKPLYYGKVQNNFYFSSELKAIVKATNKTLELDHESIGQYLKYNYIPAPRSVYKGILKLPAGHSLTMNLGGDITEPLAYFNKSKSSNFDLSPAELVIQTKELLSQSVKRQMVSDVPLGVFLSSGIDSSLIAALMQEHSSKAIQSFTIGFDISDYDESPIADSIAKHLGLEHTEYRCSSQDLLERIPKIAQIYDEPFSDSSQIPTLLLSQITRKSVTVALSGDGGDEVFAGYNRYQWLEKAHSRFKFIPNSLYNLLQLAPLPYVANKIDKLKQISKAKNLSEAYELVLQNNHLESLHTDLNRLSNISNISSTEDMMIEDQERYLPDDILVKMDRASMSTSLETRAPYLDIDLYKFISSAPLNYKIRNGETKWPLRQILREYIPERLSKAPKKGFAVPIDSWLRNELKDWAVDLLSEERLKKQNILNAEVVTQYLSEHMSGKKNRQFELWNLLVFQSWLDNWR